MDSELTQIGPLQVAQKLTRGAKTNIVICHGYGANALDLFPLSHEISLAAPVNWFFPEAPLSLAEGYFNSRAWFPLDIEELERHARMGTLDEWAERTPEYMEASRSRLIKLVEALNTQYPGKLIIGGFSQGGMMAIDLTLHLPAQPQGLMIFSTGIVARKLWLERAVRLQGLRFFQSHGESDPVIGFDMAPQVEAFLHEHGAKGSLYRFRGGHEIPPAALREAGSFLKALDLGLNFDDP